MVLSTRGLHIAAGAAGATDNAAAVGPAAALAAAVVAADSVRAMSRLGKQLQQQQEEVRGDSLGDPAQLPRVPNTC